MNNLNAFLPQAEQVAALIDALMIDELGLMAPAAYELNARDQRVYLIASYDPLMLGRSLRAYENPEITRRLRSALGMPVRINKDTGTRYIVLIHGALSLPESVDLPAAGAQLDVFRLGVGLKGEVRLTARNLRNVLIGAGQGMGKSTIEHLLAYQMLDFGWKIYLADPQSHTFNPEVWNRVAAMPVAGSQADMLKVLNTIETEMADRVMKFQMVAAKGIPPEDIDAYNLPGVAPEPLPRIGFLIDEANFYLDNKAILHRLADLLRQGRKWGLHVVIGGHEWHKDTVPGKLNDMLQTRIALNSLSGPVVLRNHHWGKWVEGRAPGRGVLKTNAFEPLQFYKVSDDLLRTRLINNAGALQSPIPANEAELVRRAIVEADGKMSTDLLIQWGLSQDDARALGARYEACGWLFKDPKRSNARFVAESLIALVDEFYPQTHKPHEPTNQGILIQDWPQTPPQTPRTTLDGQ